MPSVSRFCKVSLEHLGKGVAKYHLMTLCKKLNVKVDTVGDPNNEVDFLTFLDVLRRLTAFNVKKRPRYLDPPLSTLYKRMKEGILNKLT